jgi:hypothetical protein
MLSHLGFWQKQEAEITDPDRLSCVPARPEHAAAGREPRFSAAP